MKPTAKGGAHDDICNGRGREKKKKTCPIHVQLEREGHQRQNLRVRKAKLNQTDGSFGRFAHPGETTPERHSRLSRRKSSRRSDSLLPSSPPSPLLLEACILGSYSFLLGHMFKSVTKSAFALITWRRKKKPAQTLRILQLRCSAESLWHPGKLLQEILLGETSHAFLKASAVQNWAARRLHHHKQRARNHWNQSLLLQVCT